MVVKLLQCTNFPIVLKVQFMKEKLKPTKSMPYTSHFMKRKSEIFGCMIGQALSVLIINHQFVSTCTCINYFLFIFETHFKRDHFWNCPEMVFKTIFDSPKGGLSIRVYYIYCTYIIKHDDFRHPVVHKMSYVRYLAF